MYLVEFTYLFLYLHARSLRFSWSLVGKQCQHTNKSEYKNTSGSCQCLFDSKASMALKKKGSERVQGCKVYLILYTFQIQSN